MNRNETDDPLTAIDIIHKHKSLNQDTSVDLLIHQTLYSVLNITLYTDMEKYISKLSKLTTQAGLEDCFPGSQYETGARPGK